MRYGYALRYQWLGIGGFDLTQRGYHAQYTHHTVQLTETAVLGSSINETRFQYYRTDARMLPFNLGPEIQVFGAFNDGGSQIGRASDKQNSFELQNYTSMIRGLHTRKFGARLRGQSDDSTSPQNFNGTFSFGGGLAPELDANNQPVLDPSGQPVMVNINSIERYRRTLLFQQQNLTPSQIRALGGGATQFSISTGNPELQVGQVDMGAFVGDDWRLRPNFTVSLGLRYETQSNIHDWRISRRACSRAIGQPSKNSRPKTVVRRLDYLIASHWPHAAAERYNGIVQRQYVVTNPDTYPQYSPARISIAADRTADQLQSARSLYPADGHQPERQLPKNTTLAVTYTSRRASCARTTSTPLPEAASFHGHPGPVFLMESSAILQPEPAHHQ